MPSNPASLVRFEWATLHLYLVVRCLPDLRCLLEVVCWLPEVAYSPLAVLAVYFAARLMAWQDCSATLPGPSAARKMPRQTFSLDHHKNSWGCGVVVEGGKGKRSKTSGAGDDATWDN